MGLRCARKAASFAVFSSFDHGHDGGFPQVLGPFTSLGPQIVRLPVLDELPDGLTLAEFFVQHLRASAGSSASLGLPGTLVWALGLLVGIDMVFGGSSLIAISLEARKEAVFT
jgi:hypothetical protein